VKRRRRWALGASLAAGALILVLVISGWDQIQAWRVLQGETVTIVPDASRTAGTVEESLRVSAALRNHVYRFQARTLLEFLATRSGWPVILRASGRNALETWIELEPQASRAAITSDAVLPLLRSRGWRIVEQRFPRRAYVVLQPTGGPEPLPEDEQAEFAIYSVGDLVAMVHDIEGETVSAPDKDSDTPVEDHFTLVQLKTFLEESSGGSESGTPVIEPDARTRSLTVSAPRHVHQDLRQVLDRLRSSLSSTDRG
jgi:hypothetical protein